MTSSGPGRRERLEERRDLVGVVLPVGVERDDGVGACIEGVAEPGAQGGALAGVGDLAEDGGAGGLGLAAVSSVEPSSTTTTGR